MKGISAKIVTDEEKVRMHTNFAEFKNVSINMARSNIATWSKEDGVLKIHTNKIYSWGAFARCIIPNSKSVLKAGQKYGISLRSSNRNVGSIVIMTGDSVHVSTDIVASHWDGDKESAVVMLKEADVVNNMGIYAFLKGYNTDYELRDFRIWEIDDLGGVRVSILLIMLATTRRKEVAA